MRIVEKRSNKVLVVDDENTVCQSVKKILERKGYQVDQASSVDSALGMIRGNGRYDLVISDWKMPQESGMALLGVVRNNWPGIPVLMITGYASVPSAVKAFHLGAVDYLPKPFTPEELEKAVEEALSRNEGFPASPVDEDSQDLSYMRVFLPKAFRMLASGKPSGE